MKPETAPTLPIKHSTYGPLLRRGLPLISLAYVWPTKCTCRWTLALTTFLVGTCLTVQAAVTTVTITSTQPKGVFSGKVYVEATAIVSGTVGNGVAQHSYAVPLIIDYPTSVRDSNDYAIADILNTALFPLTGQNIPTAQLGVGTAFLFGRGYVYAQVQWDKSVTDVSGGQIAKETDGYQVIADLGALLHSPQRLTGWVTTPGAHAKVIAFGYSQSGQLLREVYLQPNHLGRAFDGALIGGSGALTKSLSDDPSVVFIDGQYTGALPRDSKIISWDAESEVLSFAGYLARNTTSLSRWYEIAGVSHFPKEVFDLSSLGLDAPYQNPVSFQPFVRAALQNLHDWIQSNREPPRNAFMDVRLDNQHQPSFVLDSEGNARGGVRLPHMRFFSNPTIPVGAPLGIYSGIDTSSFAQNDPFGLVSLGGSFLPFSSGRLHALYPSHAFYVGAVFAAAYGDVLERWILREDAESYVRAAEHSSIGN